MKYNKGLVACLALRIVVCTISIMFLGISIAFNTMADLGTDPISVFFIGMSKFTGLELGLSTNIVNFTLAVAVLIMDRKYINIGTLIYAFVLGISITLGMQIYNIIGFPDEIQWKILSAVIGCMLAFVGLASFISINIGIDPWTATAIIISKRIGKPFGHVKIVLDVTTMLLGKLLGGPIGVITLFTAVAGGPIIQKISEALDKVFLKVLKSNK